MDLKTCATCTREMLAELSHCPDCGAAQPVTARTPSKMHRNHEDKVLAGVCAGLSAQFGIDAVIIRIFFAISALVSLGTAAWAYVLLWVLMPERADGISPLAKFFRGAKGMFSSTPNAMPTRDSGV